VQTHNTIESKKCVLPVKHRLILRLPLIAALLAGTLLVAPAEAADIGSPVATTSPQSIVQQYATSTNPAVVELLVRSYFADTPILGEIAKCESEFIQFNKDGSIHRGVANTKDVGVMQINEHYHLQTAKELGYNIYTLQGNMDYAKYLYDQEGVAPWSASSGCWKKSAKVLEAKAHVSSSLAAAIK